MNRLGEFALYDEYDPRRTILLNSDGTVDKGEDGLMWFLNLFSDEGPTLNGCVEYLPNGTCVTYEHRHSDGGDAIFGVLGNDWLVGGTGRDRMFAGWGNDVLNSDDVMTIEGEGEFGDQKGRKIQPSPNDTPDTHPLFEDMAYGGAGLDILIANTGGDRNIDWVGEFNSYIVPFAPFGIATNSRQVPPWLYEFLYKISENLGADPTRDEDQNASDPDLEARNGEPHGELGLIIQKDHGLWQTQTGGPSDPQPGNIPGGRRDVLRHADFNDGSMAAFAPDSGSFAVSGGVLEIGAESLGGDAVAVLYLDDYLPKYFEIEAKISTEKPTGGWKANSYFIFDYYGPEDFKYAGVDVSNDKFEMGIRDATGWNTVAQVPVQAKPNQWYDMLVAVNGTVVTVVIDNESSTYTFDPRVVDGETYGLNTGLLGFGSNNAKGKLDNIKAQILPPQLTLDRTESFDPLTPPAFPFNETGNWTVVTEQYQGSATSGDASARIDLGKTLTYDSYLELETVVVTGSGAAGLVFDYYSDDDFKFAILDEASGKVYVGHRSGGWTVDAEADWTFDGSNNLLKIIMKGASVTVIVDGQTVSGFGYNGPLVDGGFGLLTDGSTATFDDVRVRTDDPGFDEYDPDGPYVNIDDDSVAEGDSGSVSVQLRIELSESASVPVTIDWVTGPGTALAGSDYESASGQVVFAPGETLKTITLTVYGDTEVEGNETFRVQLSDGGGGATIDDGLGIITIIDDDSAPPPPSGPELSVDDHSVIEGDTGKFWTDVTVRLSEAAPSTVTVDYTTTSGSATAGQDYESTSGSLTFSPGVTTLTVSVRILNDVSVEGNEFFTIGLSNASGATIAADPGGTVTIVDNDGALFATSFGPGGQTLTLADVEPLLENAIGHWVSLGFDTAALGEIELEIADLSSFKLAEALGNTIFFDVDAAGWGWALDGSLAEDRIDLLTALVHELGHVLGLDHAAPGESQQELMGYALSTGVRKVPVGTGMSSDRISSARSYAGSTIAGKDSPEIKYRSSGDWMRSFVATLLRAIRRTISVTAMFTPVEYHVTPPQEIRHNNLLMVKRR